MIKLKTLSLNDKGYDVYLAKLAISRALTKELDFSDTYTESFKDDVINFQRAKELNADGIFGPLTWQAALPFLYGFTIRTANEGDTFSSLAELFSTDALNIEMKELFDFTF